MGKRPLISVSSLTPEIDDHYLLATLAHVWEDQGLEVQCGQSYDPEGKVCILHHDKTHLEADQIPAPPDGVTVLNREVLDISKTRFSVLRVTENSDWTGAVIIKSDLNHFGAPERKMERAGCLKSVCLKVRTHLSWRSWRLARQLPIGCYPVLGRIDDVPAWVWQDPSLIVEKYLPERTSDGLNAIRGWVFFGDQEYCFRSVSKDKLVKCATAVRSEFYNEVPESLRKIRKQMGFDFGKFDYVQHGDDVYLLDVNKTPSLGRSYDGNVTDRLKKLASGIEAYI